MTGTPDDKGVDLTNRSVFPYWTHDKIRFADVDRYNHINNVSFAVYCESGRVEYLEEMMPGSTQGSGAGWLIVSLHLQFLAQATYPGMVDIGTRVGRIGRTSAVLQQGLFKGDSCFASAESVVVWADLTTGRSAPFPADVRSVLEGALAGS